MDVLQNTKLTVHNTVSECLRVSYSYTENVVTVKRNCDLIRGDFEIRAPKLRTVWSPEFTISVTKALVEGDHKSVRKVHTNGDLILVHLNREQLFKEVLSRVVKEGKKYGTSEPTPCCYHILCYLDMSSHLSLGQLRSVLLSDHISALLSANGAKVSITYEKIHGDHSEEATSVQDTLALLGISALGIEDRNHDIPRMTEHFKTLAECKWRDKKERITDQENNEQDERLTHDSTVVSNKDGHLYLNMKEFISENNFRGQYDKNINFVKINKESVELKCATDITEILQKNKDTKFIHVTTHRKEIQCQQIDVLSRILSGETMIHAHLRHRGVEIAAAKENEVPTALEFFRSREEQTMKAFSMKYGESSKNNNWKDIIKEVARASLKFDFLTKSFSSPVKLTTHADADDRGKSGGVFVMYNCARLSMLLSQFHKQVEEGFYSPLPSIEEIDFSALKEEEEWALLFNYISVFPGIVQNTVATVETSTIRPQVQTHKICQFLLDMVRDFSSYYSRIHVLVEPRPQLMHTMYARLTLLIALQNVIHNALALLNIPPLSHM